MPWLPATAIVICDAYHEDGDQLVEVAPRTVLRRQIDAGRSAEVTFKFASELEFYLFRNSPAEAWQRQYKGLEPLSYYRSDYHILRSTKDDWIIGKIRSGMNAAGIEVEFSKSEWGLGQQEVNLRFNPYLVFASMIMAGLHGMREKMDCGPAHLGNAYEDSALATIPGTLRDALDAFESSSLAVTGLGAEVHAHLANFARQELAAYERETVTDWERVRYFERA